MLYLLDTCILSYLEDPESEFNSATLAALEALTDDDDVCLSILSVYELEYGLEKATGLASEIEAAKRQALESYRLLPLSRRGARIFAELKSRYRRSQERRMAAKELTKHLSRHSVDLIIASSALEYDATVVSNDRIFSRLRDAWSELSVADWTVTKRT
ncbi:MAG: type II toxin-antitoxin system VapC family toxin [bacterium]|nr:type II toxin-antitoxin system VapC family toxin [bacterium]